MSLQPRLASEWGPRTNGNQTRSRDLGCSGVDQPSARKTPKLHTIVKERGGARTDVSDDHAVACAVNFYNLHLAP
jgi:hypothetical protein